MCSISMCHLLLLATTACCQGINAAHAQQQVHIKSTQLSVTVRARKINFSSNEGEIFPGEVPEQNKTTKSDGAHSENNRKSRIIVKDTFNDAPLRLPTGFRPAAAPRYPLLYPFEVRSMTRKAQAHSFTETKEKPIVSKEDWTPIAYVLEPVGGTTEREELKISTAMSGTVRPFKVASMKPMRETVIYGAQGRRAEKNSLAVKDGLEQDINFIQAVPRNAKPGNKIYSIEGDAILVDLGQQHRYSVRIKQRKGTAAKEKLHRKNQATDASKEYSTNTPEANIASNIEKSQQKRPVKSTEMADMNNQSTVTMKINSRKATKNTTKSDNSSSNSGSSASSIAGHSNTIMMSTHQKPFKSNDTTWPLNARAFATSAEEATLATDSSLQTSSSELLSSSSLATSSSASLPTLSSPAEISTSASTSATSSLSTPSASLTSTKAVEASSSSTSSATSSTSAKSLASSSRTTATSIKSASFSYSTTNPTTTMSNNLTTAEPKICVPMLVRENSSENPAEFIDLERIVCFPLPPDSDLNFDELVEAPDEVIKLAVRDRNLHEDLWNSKMSSGSSNFDKNLVILYLIISSLIFVIENN